MLDVHFMHICYAIWNARIYIYQLYFLSRYVHIFGPASVTFMDCIFQIYAIHQYEQLDEADVIFQHLIYIIYVATWTMLRINDIKCTCCWIFSFFIKDENLSLFIFTTRSLLTSSEVRIVISWIQGEILTTKLYICQYIRLQQKLKQ